MKTEEELAKLSDAELKTMLLQMAKDGEPKPSDNSVLGQALKRFTATPNELLLCDTGVACLKKVILHYYRDALTDYKTGYNEDEIHIAECLSFLRSRLINEDPTNGLATQLEDDLPHNLVVDSVNHAQGYWLFPDEIIGIKHDLRSVILDMISDETNGLTLESIIEQVTAAINRGELTIENSRRSIKENVGYHVFHLKKDGYIKINSGEQNYTICIRN